MRSILFSGALLAALAPFPSTPFLLPQFSVSKAPGFQLKARSKYMPHQGKREIARRLRKAVAV